ncbi:velvet factor-domain-containing protein [Spinellus fusiger]|nr:velvet factor-domain-containing protein [Spinellus fusiger]
MPKKSTADDDIFNPTFNTPCTYRFIPSTVDYLAEQRNYEIILRQQPQRAKMSILNERDRRPIEPPPILQLNWLDCSEEETKKYLQSPFYFMVVNLMKANDTNEPLASHQYLSGSTVSSLHRLRDVDNTDGGFFVFGDLAVKKEGHYRLHFSLFEIMDGISYNRKTILSDPFTVYLPKLFLGSTEVTFLSRTFSDQGVKMRIRKEHRVQSRKRKEEDIGFDMSMCPPRKVQEQNGRKRTSSCTTDAHFGKWQSNTSMSVWPLGQSKSAKLVPLKSVPSTPSTARSDRKSPYKDLTGRFRCPKPSNRLLENNAMNICSMSELPSPVSGTQSIVYDAPDYSTTQWMPSSDTKTHMFHGIASPSSPQPSNVDQEHEHFQSHPTASPTLPSPTQTCLGQRFSPAPSNHQTSSSGTHLANYHFSDKPVQSYHSPESFFCSLPSNQAPTTENTRNDRLPPLSSIIRHCSPTHHSDTLHTPLPPIMPSNSTHHAFEPSFPLPHLFSSFAPYERQPTQKSPPVPMLTMPLGTFA